MYEALIVSRADYPITIKYNGEYKVVSPREKFLIEKISNIEGKLPSGLKLQRINK